MYLHKMTKDDSFVPYLTVLVNSLRVHSFKLILLETNIWTYDVLTVKESGPMYVSLIRYEWHKKLAESAITDWAASVEIGYDLCGMAHMSNLKRELKYSTIQILNYWISEVP
jgi:hypothetical protein